MFFSTDAEPRPDPPFCAAIALAVGTTAASPAVSKNPRLVICCMVQPPGTLYLDSARPASLLRRRALRWILQACVNRLDEHVRSPRAGGLSEADIKVGGESGGFDLIESSAVCNHGLNTVTGDDQHVALCGKPPCTGYAFECTADPFAA